MSFTRREQLALLASLGSPDHFAEVVMSSNVSLQYKIKLLAAFNSGDAERAELVAMITAESTVNGHRPRPAPAGPAEPPPGAPQIRSPRRARRPAATA